MAEEMSLYDLRVTVERIEGRSVCGLSVGDYFELTESSKVRIPDGGHFCLYALQSVLPLLPAKQRQLPASTGSSRTRSSRAPTPTSADHADRAHRGANAPHQRSDVTAARELGLALQTDKAARHVRSARPHGGGRRFDVVTTFNDLWFQPALPRCSRSRSATERVRVGPTCLNPFTLHPVEIAGQIAALDRASHGRAFLGLAAGLARDARRRPRPAARDDARGVGGRPAPARRRHVRLRRRPLQAAGRARGCATTSSGPRCRCSSAPGRPRLAAFAGTAARELKVGGSTNPDVVPVLREWIGNDDVGIVLGAVTVVDEDGDRARALARREVAMYFDIVGALRPDPEPRPRAARRIRALVAQGEDDAAGALLSADLLSRFAFAGTPAEVAEHAAALFDAGALRVDFGTPHGIDENRGIELLCREVLPLLDSRRCSTTRTPAPPGRAHGGRGRRRAVPRAVGRPRVPDRRRAPGPELRRGLVRARLGDRRVLPARAPTPCSSSRACSRPSTCRRSPRASWSSSARPTTASPRSSASPAGLGAGDVAIGDRVWAETVLNLGRIVGFDRLRTGSTLVNELRRVKTDEELEAMGRAIATVEQTMAAVTPLVVPGVSMLELAEAVEHELLARRLALPVVHDAHVHRARRGRASTRARPRLATRSRRAPR